MSGKPEEMRSLALTPTWSVATVLTIFVFVSLLVERSIHRLSSWLKKTHRNPLFEAVEKMKEELMLLGFISLLLTATSRTISSICIDSKFYNSNFSPCTRSEVDDSVESDSGSPPERKQLMEYLFRHSMKRLLSESTHGTCTEGYEPFVSYEGLEQLHRFIFVMAITHVSYSCLTMLLAIVKIHTWRSWEDEAQKDQFDAYCDITTRALTMRRQSTFVKFHAPHSWSRNGIVVWVICFFRQFGRSVARADYLTLRRGFIMNHNLTSRYDFHSYMIRSMEEEFKKIVGVSAPLWGFVIGFMLFNINGSNLYFWIAIIPITLVLLVGAKLQHVIATLALESAGISGLLNGGRLKPRDDLFWFKKPELLLNLIHFILFQNSFELASFFWFWWQFGYDSCYIRNHLLVYIRLILGFAGQFLCSYSTLPLYALVTQMGSNYKAALIPQRIRETIHGWGKAAKKRRRHRRSVDESTIRTETSTVCSIEEDEQLLDDHYNHSFIQIELQPNASIGSADNDQHSPAADESTIYSTNSNTPLLHCSFSVPTSPSLSDSRGNGISRSASMPVWRS
ncbi:MLO-like protein 14 [Dioscorea cayenensis subsp. rotundata]|uniref:MLO-like protein n=1 Tax=Dioscorea cayennensis subsp. rotundata TaxID=55577 RepID=A0AB40C6J7_DIOCR|nr:MLO-like protein 14 [Dioscorea cayenensis subsp. rotundata]XP_039135402.1 MLO-like protein 14 [Dioscorea cayenensis subsp. rotundata]